MWFLTLLLPLRFASRAFDAPETPKKWTRLKYAQRWITNKANGLLDEMPGYYSFHMITGQVDETVKVDHVRTLSFYFERKDRGTKCKIKKGRQGQKGDSLSAAPAPQCQNPADVATGG